jgi:excisionase family DNA binding protein
VRVTAERYLSLQEVGDELGVSDQTVRRWVKAGELAAYKPGKEYRIKGSALEEFLKTREVHPKASASSQPSFDRLLEEERRVAINYGVLRDKLADFCSYWQEILDAGGLDRRGLEDFNAAAAVLSPTYLELWGAEKADLGPQEDAGEPVFHSERSTLWPAIDQFITLGIQMDRIARQRFDHHGTAEVIDIFKKRLSSRVQ